MLFFVKFCRMTTSSSSTRHSTRPSRQPESFQEEQGHSILSQLEQRDIAAALRLSLVNSWNSDDENDNFTGTIEFNPGSDEEQDDIKIPELTDQEEKWTSNLHNIKVELPRLRVPHKTKVSSHTSVFELLQLFLPKRLMQEFAHHTNNAAPHDWRSTTISELYAFLGVHLFMGIARLPNTDMYWLSEFGHQLISSHFSRDRYKQLVRFFRVAATYNDAAAGDPLPHVRSLVDTLNDSFAAHYTPSQFLALDESMVAFKGRSPIKQYIPSKPHKWGYKIYCLSSDDYLLHFEIFGGPDKHASRFGSTYDTVLRMVQGYENKQHVLFMDNYFTAPVVLDALKEKGIRCCGSVRSNRKGMPKIPQNEVESLGRGQWLQRQREDMTVAVWKDRKVIWLLYNHCSPQETSSLERWGSTGNKISIDCPRAIYDYLYHARSVDVLNQLHYSYLTGRKSIKCWSRLAWWLLDMCIINSFKLWSTANQTCTHLQFRIQLMHELLEQLPTKQMPRKRRADHPLPPYLAHQHYTAHAAEARDCVVCSRQPSQRMRTHFICATCQVHLCMGTCFADYHS
jgi:hypothetical protein